MALVNQSELEARLGRSLKADEASAFSTINDAVQAYIEKRIGSSVESVSESIRFYDGGRRNLSIDPCTSITQLRAVDEDGNNVYTYPTDEYTTEPVNQTCKYWLRSRLGKFLFGYNNIEVTAKFSTYEDTELTAIIKDAILSFLENEINDTSNIAKESIEGYSIEYASKQSKSALSKLDYVLGEV